MTSSLLSRLEALTGPSREVDVEYALANGWVKENPDWLKKERWRRPDGHLRTLPRYTESLDAAVSALPDGWGFKVETDDWQQSKTSEHLSDSTFASVHNIKRTRECRSEPNDEKQLTGIFAATHFSGRAATPAIALLIAILRARETEGK